MLKNIYKIPEYKKLDKAGKIIFVLSFIIPLLIIYLFLHFYFLPFGYNKNFDLDSRELNYVNSSFIYEKDNSNILDGIATLEIKPRIPKRNLITTISVEGDGVYVIPERLNEEDIIFSSDFEIEPTKQKYTLLDYKVEENSFLSFKLELDMELWDREILSNAELIFKYMNISLTRHYDHIQVRFNDIINQGWVSYYIEGFITEEEFDKPVVVYINYKPIDKTNGFIELFVNNRFAGREIISEPTNIFLDKESIFHEEFLKDISQEHISIYQEEYAMNLTNPIPYEFREFIDYKLYYEGLFKQGIEIDKENHYFITDGNTRIQTYYDKMFFKKFSGEINRLAISYEYPFKKLQKITTLYPITPFEFVIFGENGEIENLEVNLFREPIWKKF